jgi:hypothetical protein
LATAPTPPSSDALGILNAAAPLLIDIPTARRFGCGAHELNPPGMSRRALLLEKGLD